MNIVVHATRICASIVQNPNLESLERTTYMKAKSQVTRFPSAVPEIALGHFRARFAFETDCSDVHHAVENDVADFVLLDTRSEELFRAGHASTAVRLPHSQITLESLPPLENKAVYVVYCAGPHCNGANKAALRIASLGLPVKEMIGGIEGWKDEGFELVSK